MTGPVGRLHHLVWDCPDPEATAQFWAALLGQRVTHRDADFAVVAPAPDTSGLAFQRAPEHLAALPGPRLQAHPDVMVDDLAAAAAAVLALGARHLTGDVWADPAGHPFCLVPRPGWAPPVG